MLTTIKALQQLAAGSPNKEICGVVDTNGVVYPITNVAKVPGACFVFSKREYFTLIKELQVSGLKLAFVYHSHPSGNPTPSEADMSFTKRSGIPQVIVTSTDFKVVARA